MLSPLEKEDRLRFGFVDLKHPAHVPPMNCNKLALERGSDLVEEYDVVPRAPVGF